MGWLWCERPYNEIPPWASEMLTGRHAALGFSPMPKPFESDLPYGGHVRRVDGCVFQPKEKQGGPEVVPAPSWHKSRRGLLLPGSCLYVAMACVYVRMCLVIMRRVESRVSWMSLELSTTEL